MNDSEWQLMPNRKAPRIISASMACHEGRLYVLGGVNDSPEVLSVEIFQCEENGWKAVSVIPVDCFEPSEEKQKTIIYNYLKLV